MLNDKAQKFDVNKIEYRKRDSNYRIANENENEIENKHENNQQDMFRQKL